MIKAPFFSVVVALYNKEIYIENTINSILNQSFTDFELIVVDDGSTDSSNLKVNAIKDYRLKLYTIRNHGASYARNYGILKAKANYIAFLDADDLWLNNHLKITYSLLNDFPNTGMYCTGYKIQFGSKHLKKTKLKGISNNYRGVIENYFECNLFNSIVHSSAVVIPKYVFEDVGMFDLDMKSGHDTCLWTQIAVKYEVAIDNITTATVLRNDNSLSNSTHVKDRLLFLDKFIEQEKTNKYLKRFMDMNRYAVAVNFKMNNNGAISKSIFKNIDSKNISFKQKFIFSLPTKLLRITFKLKKYLDKKGIFFHLYR